MTTYAIGDVQGCFDDLLRLLDKLDFNEHDDKLWFVGDLVNRGPKSLETLRFVKSLKGSAVTVLGNHDLHLLAVAQNKKKLHRKDTLKQILIAPDCEELLHWLRHRPLFHYDDNFCLLHAGLPPEWDFELTKEMAHKAEKMLTGPDYQLFFSNMYANQPTQWSENLTGIECIRFIINCFTRMRYCDIDGHLDFEQKGTPDTQPNHLIPWFMLPNRKSRDMKIIFGHWSTLGYYAENNCYGIDTGCLWGGELTALKLGSTVSKISVSCAGELAPG